MSEPDAPPLRVLVVDDEPIVCRTLPRALRRLGFEVKAFGDPEEALAEIAAGSYDLVITDVVMGEIDGIQILEAALRRSARTKVIIITAFATRDLAREAMERGAFDFIAKPFEASEIRAKARRAAEALRIEAD